MNVVQLNLVLGDLESGPCLGPQHPPPSLGLGRDLSVGAEKLRPNGQNPPQTQARGPWRRPGRPGQLNLALDDLES